MPTYIVEITKVTEYVLTVKDAVNRYDAIEKAKEMTKTEEPFLENWQDESTAEVATHGFSI